MTFNIPLLWISQSPITIVQIGQQKIYINIATMRESNLIHMYVMALNIVNVIGMKPNVLHKWQELVVF